MVQIVSNIEGMIFAAGSSLAASVIAKATVIMAAGITGASLARRSRASLRHALLAAAFGALLLLPIAAVIAPPLRIALPVGHEQITPLPVTQSVAALPLPTAINQKAEPAIAEPERISLSTVLFAGWITGLTLFLAPMAAGARKARSIRQSGMPWPHGQSVSDGLRIDAGIRRHVEVLLHERLPGPMTCGVLHAVVVLPSDAQTWDAEELNRALVHELEHVRRNDWLSHCLARVACAAYWFHPLVWMAWNRLSLEAERSCDDAVLARSEATAYADQLVGLALRMSAGTPMLAMANRADLARRIGAVLDSRQQRGRAGIRSVAMVCAGAAALVIAISPLAVVAAQQSEDAVIATNRVPQGQRVISSVARPQEIASLGSKPPGMHLVFQRPAGVAAMAHYTANAILVLVDATVSDASSKPIDTLRANDFIVSEDDKAQDISVFEFQKLDGTDIGSYYVLGYYSANQNADGRYRAVKVGLKGDATAKVDFRAGYYANKSFAFSGPIKSFTISGGPGPANAADSSAASDSSEPAVVSKVDPEYSEEARKAKYSGSVVLDIQIDGSGRVIDMRIDKSLGMGLDQKAIEAVSKWRFAPSANGGFVKAQVEVNFRLM